MKFSLTQDHIERGAQRECAACPVALVIQETMQDDGYLVDGETLVHNGYDLWLLLPEKVNKWVRWYDKFYVDDLKPENRNDPDYPKAVAPIEFELPIDEYFGKPYTHRLDPIEGIVKIGDMAK